MNFLTIFVGHFSLESFDLKKPLNHSFLNFQFLRFSYFFRQILTLNHQSFHSQPQNRISRKTHTSLLLTSLTEGILEGLLRGRPPQDPLHSEK